MADPPAITGMTPYSVDPNNPDFPLYLSGSELNAGSKILFDGKERMTSLEPDGRLKSVILSTDVKQPGFYEVMVKNSDGQKSNTWYLEVRTGNQPLISSIEPVCTYNGRSAALDVRIKGKWWSTHVKALFDKEEKYIVSRSIGTENGDLVMRLYPADMATAGAHQVQLRNPDGLLSNVISFNICAAPRISSIVPASASKAAGGPVTLTVTGTSFNADAKVYWNAVSLPITSRSATKLVATIGKNLIANTQTGQKTVCVEQPCGQGTLKSNLFFFDLKA
jgi:hypothetical protein